MRTVCIIEHPEQFLALKRRFPEAVTTMSFFCASLEVEKMLSSQRVEFVPLRDDALTSEWEAINTWARQTSFDWFDRASFLDELTVGGVNFGDAVSRPLSHALVFALKTQLLVDHLFLAGGFENAIVFEDYLKRSGKRKKITRSLNCEFARQLRLRGIPFKVVRVELVSADPFSLRRSFKEAIRSILTMLFSLLPVPEKNIPYIGMGAIGHILPVLSRLRDSGEVIFLEDVFHLDTWKSCLKNKIGYRLMGAFCGVRTRLEVCREARRVVNKIKKIFANMKQDDLFCYRGQPVLSSIEAVTDVLEKYLFSRLSQAVACERVFSKMSGRVLILHEDVNAFRAAALTARQRRLPVVVISHGIPPTRSDWREMSDKIGIAQTIVNSDFEKEKYVLTGYDPASLFVLGLPRFDRIFEAVRHQPPKKDSPNIVLYCPHMLRDLAQHQVGFLGVHTPGTLTREYAISVMEACKRAGASLWIKLHDDQDVDRWRDLCDKYGGPGLKFFEHYHDIFSLIAKCDLVVTTFSTVVIEALLFDRDVVSMNYTGLADIHPYSDRGVALPARDPGMLEEAIRSCLGNESLRSSLKENRASWATYFGGPFDGKNTERVAAFICALASAKETKPIIEMEHA